MSRGYKQGGWEDKYIIYKWKTRTRRKQSDWESDTYRVKVPVDPDAKYFVLRYDKDPNAVVAMLAYADSVEAVNPEFADDIRAKLAERGE